MKAEFSFTFHPSSFILDDMLLRELGENSLVLRLRELLKSQRPAGALLVGPGDDAAVLRAPSDRLTLFTGDALVEEVHFRRAWMPPRSLGWKSLAVNVSDIAAMGGLPTFALVTLSLPSELETGFLDSVYEGLIACGEEHGCQVVGGDLVGSPGPISVSIALLGEVEPERLLRRSGAQVGDAILVTGRLGGSAAGLHLLTNGVDPGLEMDAIKRQLEPRPRLREARFLAESGLVTAMMDLSDGLADDLPRLCLESKVGASVIASRVPVHPALCVPAPTEEDPHPSSFIPHPFALAGGEDYELLFTAPAPKAAQLAGELEKETGTPATVIGESVAEQAGVQFLDKAGRPLARPEGYRHFG